MRNISNMLFDKKTAYILTRYCWRDLDVVEDYHAGEPKPCNKAFYDTVYVAMSKRINDWLPRYIKEVCYQNTHFATASISDKDVNDIAVWYSLQYGEWDSPKQVKSHFKGDVVKFLLQGAFLKACYKGALLDDTTMCILNHDIYNRMYTLLRRNIIQIIE